VLSNVMTVGQGLLDWPKSFQGCRLVDKNSGFMVFSWGYAQETLFSGYVRTVH